MGVVVAPRVLALEPVEQLPQGDAGLGELPVHEQGESQAEQCGGRGGGRRGHLDGTLQGSFASLNFFARGLTHKRTKTKNQISYNILVIIIFTTNA